MDSSIETKEAPKTSPDTASEVSDQVKNFLEQLKSDVEKQAPEKKKEFVRQRVASLNKEQLEELSKRVDARAADVPTELLKAHINILDLIDQRKAALRAQIEAGADKPEGFMAQAGDALKKGTETFMGWIKGTWGWTEGKAGKGWKGFAEGLTAAIATVGKGFSWLREKSAHMFGSLAASVDGYLPEWVKKPLNFMMGDYGVLYKNLSKKQIELVPNNPDQKLSLEEFMKQYTIYMHKNDGATFDAFCSAVVRQIVNDPRYQAVIPLRITQVQLEEAALRVAQAASIVTPPPAPSAVAAAPNLAPAVVPGVAPAVAPAAAPVVPSVAPAGAPAPAPAATPPAS